jgi:hypothetical protein
MAKLDKVEFDKIVRSIIDPQSDGIPKMKILFDQLAKQNMSALPMGIKPGLNPMQGPTQNPALNPAVNPLGTFSQNQNVTAMQKYPFLGTK